MILNKENTFTEQNRFLVYSDQLNATRKQILDTAEEMISRSAIQTFEDEGETITATDASYLAGLTADGKAVQDGTPTPSNPVEIQVVQAPDGGTFGISVNGTVTPIDLQGNVLASLPDGTRDVLTVDSVGHVVDDNVLEYGVLDGTENWIYYSGWNSSDQYCYYLSALRLWNENASRTCMISSALNGTSRTDFVTNKPNNTCALTGATDITVRVPYATVAEWKAYLVANPMHYVALKKVPQTIDLGYIDMPAIPDGSTISITAQVTPTIAAKWWTKNQSGVAAAFGAVSSDLAALQDEISVLDARVTALEGSNAKSLVLEKLERAKEPLEEIEPEEADEQEEMNLDEE